MGSLKRKFPQLRPIPFYNNCEYLRSPPEGKRQTMYDIQTCFLRFCWSEKHGLAVVTLLHGSRETRPTAFCI